MKLNQEQTMKGLFSIITSMYLTLVLAGCAKYNTHFEYEKTDEYERIVFDENYVDTSSQEDTDVGNTVTEQDNVDGSNNQDTSVGTSTVGQDLNVGNQEILDESEDYGEAMLFAGTSVVVLLFYISFPVIGILTYPSSDSDRERARILSPKIDGEYAIPIGELDFSPCNLELIEDLFDDNYTEDEKPKQKVKTMYD